MANSPAIIRDEEGFSLLETLIACGLMVTALVSLAQLFSLSVRSNASSRDTSLAVTLATQKLEVLRVAPWAFDATGVARGSPGTDGLSSGVDYVDRAGRVVSRGSAAFVREWWVDALTAAPDRTISVEVAVAPAGGRAVRRDARLPGEVRLLSLRTRLGI
jgi:hypothetical protein